MKDIKPVFQQEYRVFGTINRNSEHEKRTQFKAFWWGVDSKWGDKDGEDLIEINESIEYWWEEAVPNDPPEEMIWEETNHEKEIKKYVYRSGKSDQQTIYIVCTYLSLNSDIESQYIVILNNSFILTHNSDTIKKDFNIDLP